MCSSWTGRPVLCYEKCIRQFHIDLALVKEEILDHFQKYEIQRRHVIFIFPEGMHELF